MNDSRIGLRVSRAARQYRRFSWGMFVCIVCSFAPSRHTLITVDHTEMTAKSCVHSSIRLSARIRVSPKCMRAQRKKSTPQRANVNFSVMQIDPSTDSKARVPPSWTASWPSSPAASGHSSLSVHGSRQPPAPPRLLRPRRQDPPQESHGRCSPSAALGTALRSVTVTGCSLGRLMVAAGVLYRSSGLTRSSARSRILSVSQSSSAVRVTDWSSVSVLTAECEAGAVVVSFLSAGVPRPGAPSGVWGVEEGEGSVFGTGRLHLVV